MTLKDLGYNQELEEYRLSHDLSTLGIGRVSSEHKGHYTVKSAHGEYDAELLGNLRFSATNRADLPAVGDWVAISEYDDDKALIHNILPRKSTLERKAVGKLGQTQIIATNIDFGLIVQSVNRDFSINRLERYMTICNASKIIPIIVLSKIDLIGTDELSELLKSIKQRIKTVSVIPISNQSLQGISEIKSLLKPGKTYCLLGSSGVGKSTLINSLLGSHTMNTGAISESIDRGKHITSHRELIVLDNGILIDNPGMREVGITNISDGLEKTFDDIVSLAQNCKYKDCTHTNESGCAVIAAVDNGELDAATYDNFIKMEKEKTHFESNAQERRKKDKDFGKMIKGIQKQRRKNKF